MSTESITELPRPKSPPRRVERLKFVTGEFEDVTSFDLVNSLVGLTWALDLEICSRDDQHERDIKGGLATAARLLAEQLQTRLESTCQPRRREGAR